MTTTTTNGEKDSEVTFERIIGEYGSGEPLLIITAGLHGNEPAGVEAARRVCDWLSREQTGAPA